MAGIGESIINIWATENNTKAQAAAEARESSSLEKKTHTVFQIPALSLELVVEMQLSQSDTGQGSDTCAAKIPSYNFVSIKDGAS